jgi:hypothetical protein
MPKSRLFCGLGKRNGSLRARRNAQAASGTGINIRGIGNLHAMYALLESMQKSEPAVINLLDAPDLKDVLRAHAHTISLAFAAFEVHHRHDGSWFLLAGCLRSTAV